MIVSEADWAKLQPVKDEEGRELWKPREHYNNLGELIVDFAENVGFQEDDFQRIEWSSRPLGADFID